MSDLVESSARNQERKAILQFISDHRGYLRAVIRARLDPRLSTRLDVSDIIQETQVAALRRLDGFLAQQQVSPREWLRLIACDQTVMAHRKHLQASKRSLLRESSGNDAASCPVEQVVGKTKTPSRIIGDRHETKRVEQAIAQLSEKDQQVIRLQVFEHLSSQEAGDVLDVSSACIRQRLCRALIRLREILGGEAGSPNNDRLQNG